MSDKFWTKFLIGLGGLIFVGFGMADDPLRRVQGVEITSQKPGEIREYSIGNGQKLKLCWIPRGKAKLGSPTTEKYRDSDEGEHEFTTEGFWLGKLPISQSEWTAIMGKNPSWFSKNGGGKSDVAGIDTDRFPVESVSWADCKEFLSALNRLIFPDRLHGERGRFSLPTENEWEYACRGGRGNAKPFYFGSALNGTQANCCGDWPYGTAEKGPCRCRTSAIGDYENLARHPWGLCDMSGNVTQWCENYYDESELYRVSRGGCWNLGARYCRSATRFREELKASGFATGLRVCIRPNK
jgi:formylglycine-generating enzyme required for sulfatase activity